MSSSLAFDFLSPRCQLFHDYWWRLKESSEQIVPHKSDFNPAAIKPVLPYVLLHDLTIPGKSLLRLVGTAIVDRMGIDATGRDYLDFVSPERRDKAYHHLQTTSSLPCGMRVVIEGRYQSGRVNVSETVGYPLEATGEAPRFMIFVDDIVETMEYQDVSDKQLEYYRVRRRDYIDIGAGIPTVKPSE
ncbi:PAS domain-containing protein [Kiloniella laminariae]|uniref:PAS domain-containing protein n=1 Tax=Kiloniella laminariae TaxID=454162 RepID=A0ABT4LJI4_9PROT|nr:PAS domain-containing protein [Kiloniella laminariae]MCZ4281273.1 PAS domain-containing protein [Kiloniella laminariae]